MRFLHLNTKFILNIIQVLCMWMSINKIASYTSKYQQQYK
jgi:hypothetical protein